MEARSDDDNVAIKRQDVKVLWKDGESECENGTRKYIKEKANISVKNARGEVCA